MPDNKSVVNTNILRAKALAGKRRVQSMANLLTDMDRRITTSENCWAGEASDYYRQIFRTEFELLKGVFAEYRIFAQQLEEFADHFEATDAEAQGIANNIEVANASDFDAADGSSSDDAAWADV